MTKPPLGKVEALLYVLQHVTKRGCARILTHPHLGYFCFISYLSQLQAEGDANAPCVLDFGTITILEELAGAVAAVDTERTV